jgi:hypothetical protein
MVVDGDTLYTLNMNLDGDQNGSAAKLLAPPSIHAFTISQDGLTPKTFGPQHLQAGKDISDGYARILDGFYNPAAIANVGDGRLAVLIRGIGSAETGADGGVAPPSPSHILLFNTADGSYARESINLASMVAGASNQLPIVKLNSVSFALVGAGDGSGRVAKVNLDTGDVKYVGVFGPGHNVVGVVVDEAGSQAIAVSNQGKVISLNLKEIDLQTQLPTVGEAHDLPADARVAALRGNSLVVAHPNKYSQVTITPVSQ